jgi:iron complex outermembrane receptor protein
VYQDKIYASVETLYMSERKTLAGQKTGSHTLVGLTLLFKKFREGVEFTASVRNLFNKRFSDPASEEQLQDQIEQDGRTFWLKLKYRF